MESSSQSTLSADIPAPSPKNTKNTWPAACWTSPVHSPLSLPTSQSWQEYRGSKSWGVWPFTERCPYCSFRKADWKTGPLPLFSCRRWPGTSSCCWWWTRLITVWTLPALSSTWWSWGLVGCGSRCCVNRGVCESGISAVPRRSFCPLDRCRYVWWWIAASSCGWHPYWRQGLAGRGRSSSARSSLRIDRRIWLP